MGRGVKNEWRPLPGDLVSDDPDLVEIIGEKIGVYVIIAAMDAPLRYVLSADRTTWTSMIGPL